MSNNQTIETLYLCRPELSGALCEELQAKQNIDLVFQSPAPGLVLVQSETPGPCTVCIFERQRMPFPRFIPIADLKPIEEAVIRTVFQAIITEHPLWTVHLVSPEGLGDDTTKPSRNLEGIWNTLLRLGRKVSPDLEKRYRAPHRLKTGGLVLQLLMTQDGLWHSIECVENMVNPKPGGISRMKWDPDAPSRSYLKVEEALEWIPAQPEPGARVIDLGAAPGGWTFAFLKRGCHVLCVDHGPMKLPPHQDGWGAAEHVKKNGITFEPPADWPRVDWLIADMLIAPGVAQGLLRRWIQSAKAEHIICNIKLPQEEPYQAIRPVEEMMAEQHAYAYRIKQLYHDRREVTLMAWKKGSKQHPISDT